ncbi:MAG: hypothetical protein WC546_05105 [Candidatus Omnitrophota bacterium]
MKKKNFKIAQSILEYICVTMVFAGVGIGGFILANQASVSDYRGQVATYKAPATVQGKILEDGVSNSQYKWSSDWGEPQAAFDGEVPNSLVNNPDAGTLSVPTGAN